MPTLDDVYRKFGEVAEAAQLLETELGNMLIAAHVAEENLIAPQNSNRAAEVFQMVDSHTLGQLLKHLATKTQSITALETLLKKALQERNRLSHSFYRQHNFRRNSEEGRTLMFADLELIHYSLIEAYKAVMLLSGVDLDALAAAQREQPSKWVKL